MFIHFILYSLLVLAWKCIAEFRAKCTPVFSLYYIFLTWILIVYSSTSIYGLSPDNNNNNTCFNTSAFFNCTDGLYCIPVARRCNSAGDCRDASDEMNCSTSENIRKCTTGYEWSQIGCVDIDECQEFLTCSQTCANTPGSFTCSCVQGYELDTQTGTFCSATGSLPYILVTGGDSIYSLYPDSESGTITYSTQFSKYRYISQLQDVNAISFHYTKQLVFWSDASKHALYMHSLSQPLSVTNPYSLISPLIRDTHMSPVSLAVDWISDKLYWTDELNGRVEVSGLDGTNRRVLISGLVRPRSLTVDAEWGYLFFSICDPFEPKILRSNMDGSNIITLHNTSLMFPNAVAIDLPTHTLYWLDAGLGRIDRSDVTGANRHTVVSDRNQIRNPTSMAVYEDTIYFTDTDMRGVIAVHKDGSSHRQIARRINKALSLQIVYPSAQPYLANSDPCTVNNGGCSHLCLLSNKSSHTCVCPTLRIPSYKLGIMTCLYPTQFMLAVTVMSVRVISLLDPNYVDAQLDIAAPANITGLVWDDSATSLYWSSGLYGCIYRYQLGEESSILLFQDKLIRITDMAYDWVHHLLFFIDGTNKRIEVFSVNNPNLRSVVIPHGLYRPTSIVVDPIRGYIAWIDISGTKYVIMTSGMDGSNRRVLVSHKLLEPTILTVDYRSDYLYWYDKGSERVEKVHFDGTRRRTVMSTSYTVSAFSVYRGFIFWSPEELDQIFQYNPSTRSNATIFAGLPSISHLSIYYQRSELTANFNTSCSTSPTNCSQFCVLRGGSFNTTTNPVCLCLNGYELTDSSQCSLTADYYAALLQDNDLYYSAVQNSSLRTLLRIRASNVTSIALDPSDPGVLFLAEDSPKGTAIKRVSFDEDLIANFTILYSHLLGSVSDIAIEPRTRLLYWIDSHNGVMEVGSVAGDKRTVILGGLLNPMFILLDINESRLYWVELRRSGSFISCSDLDGANRQKVKSLLDTEITSFALAALSFDGELVQYLLWTVHSSHNIFCYEIELDFIYFIPSPSHSPRSIIVHESEIFWYAPDSNTIYTATLIPGNPPYLRDTRAIFTTELPLSTIAVQSYRSRSNPTTPCSHATTCSYLCLPSHIPPGYSCHCQTGIEPRADSYCPLLPSRFLLVSLHSEIHYVSLDTRYKVPVLLYREDKLVTGAADVYAQRRAHPCLIWSDITNRKSWAIKKMDIATRVVSVLVRGVFTRGLAVDQNAGNLFYTDRFDRSIMVYNLETNTIERLVTNDTSHNVLKPRSLAIDPGENFIFWTDWGMGTLERSRLDGTERKVIVTHSILEPSGLTIDLVRQRLYWVDYAYKTIESCDYRGLNRLRVAHNLSQPYSITLNYPDIYFTDWTNNTLNHISLLNPASHLDTTYQSTSIIMDVQFIEINTNNKPSTETTHSASTDSTTTQSYYSTTTSYLSSYPQEHLFTILYILAALLLFLVFAFFIILAMIYCNHRKLKRKLRFSPHSIHHNKNSAINPIYSLAFTDAIFSLTNNSPSPQQQATPTPNSTQPVNIPSSPENIDNSNLSLIPLKPLLSTSHEGAADATSTPYLTPGTSAPNSVVSTHDYTPKRPIAHGKVRNKLISKFQETTGELATPLPSFKYNALSPSKKNSSLYNSSCF